MSRVWKSGLIPVGAPLPDVAGHVVEAVAVRREGVHRARCRSSRRQRVLAAGTRPARRSSGARRRARARRPRGTAAPRGRRAPRTPTRPRSAGACPPSRSRPAASFQRDVHDRMVRALVEVGLRTLRLAPVRALDLAPPRRVRHGPRGREVVGQQAGEDERPAEALGLGDVAGRLDEARRTPRSRRRRRRSRTGRARTRRTGPSPSPGYASGRRSPIRNSPPGRSTVPASTRATCHRTARGASVAQSSSPSAPSRAR